MSKSNVSDILKGLKKEFKSDMSTLEELDEFSTVSRWVSTGSPDIDLLFQTYGFPPGINEISGQPQCGKTTMSLHFIKEVQRNSGIPLLISTERRDNKYYAKTIGVNNDNVAVFKTKTIEGSFDWIEKNISSIRKMDSTIPIGIVWDSLGGTPSKAELKAGAEDDHMATAARAIKKNLRRVTQLLDDGDITLLIVNQTYSKIGMMFGKKTTSYGGDAVKYHSQLRAELTRISYLKIGDKRVGQKTRVELLKSDFSIPWRHSDIDIIFGVGIVPSKNILEFAEERGIIEPWKTGFVLKRMPKFRWKKIESYYEMIIDDPIFRGLFNNILLSEVHKYVDEYREEQKKRK